MNILLAHFRVGETDGVSLEMDKWKWALEALGHKVYYLAGSSGNCEAECIESLHYLDPLNDKIIQNAYVELTDYSSDEQLVVAIEHRAEVISKQVIEVIKRLNIDIIVPNNIWSLGYHLPAAIGIHRAVEQTGIQAICHHHDFHWERDKYSAPTSEKITDLLNQYFPPKHAGIQHCVINHIAQRELKSRRNIDSHVVPNVFDFHGSDWKIDEYNLDLRQRFSIRDNDIIFLQATRIVARKGIELAIDHIAEIGRQKSTLLGRTLYNGKVFNTDSRLILVLAGMCEEESYQEKLTAKADKLGVELLFINEWVGHSRSEVNGEKIYSLWDIYAHADIITYPSLLEGWGNQFLEGLIAQIPMVVYRYPVYATDIEEFHFDIIDLGEQHELDDNGLAYIDHELNTKATKETIRFLLEAENRNEKMKRNYQIGENNFSYPVLSKILNSIFSQ